MGKLIGITTNIKKAGRIIPNANDNLSTELVHFIVIFSLCICKMEKSKLKKTTRKQNNSQIYLIDFLSYNELSTAPCGCSADGGNYSLFLKIFKRCH